MRRTLITALAAAALFLPAAAAQASPTYPTQAEFPWETALAWLAVAGAGLVIVGGLSRYLARRRQREENARWLEEAVPYATADAEATAKLYDPLARVRQAEAYKELP